MVHAPVRSAQRPVPLKEPSPLQAKLARTWARHPLVSFARHRKDLAFYRQLHALIRSGLGLPVVFADLAKYAPDEALRRGLLTVGAELRDGVGLAEAMARHEALFSDVNVELLAFAEEAGKLDTVLPVIIGHMEDVQKLRWQTVFMSLWPLYLVGAFVFVGPLLEVSRAANLTAVGPLYLAGLLRNLGVGALTLGALFSFPFVLTALGLESRWAGLTLRLPAVGGAVRDLAASRLMLGLGLALGAGLETMRAVRLAGRATANPAVLEQLPAAEAVLRGGGTLTDGLRALELVDRTTLGTLAVAERTGTLDSALTKVSAELQEAAIRATRLLLLAAIALVAGALLVTIVGSLLGTLFGPIKTMYDAAGSGNLESIGGK